MNMINNGSGTATEVDRKVAIWSSVHYVWKIPNWLTVKESMVLRTQEQFEVQVANGLSFQTTWLVGIKNAAYNPDYYHIFFRLIRKTGGGGGDTAENPGDTVTARFTAKLMQGDNAYWMEEMEGVFTLNEDNDLPERCHWTRSHGWDGFLDTITGAMTVLIELSVQEEPADWIPSEKNVASNNLTLLLTADSIDFDTKLICSDGKELKCHREVLKGRSRVFERMLESGMSEQTTGIVQIDDVPGRVMELLLNYMYTGNLRPAWKDPEIIVEFIYAAGKYELLKLLEYLDHTLGRMQLDKGCVLQVLELTTKLELRKAEEMIVDEIRKAVLTTKSSEELISVLRRVGGDS